MSSDLNTDYQLEFKDVPEPRGVSVSSGKIVSGRLIPPQQQILLYSADDWEGFIEEWLHFQKTKSNKVVRFAGANDMGVDVATFVDDKGFQGIWDCYQCKHYNDPLTPKTAIAEIGKIVWHVHMKHITCPRQYYFLAPKDCGMSLKKVLLNKQDLKNKLIEKWDDWCSKSITSKKTISLEGGLGIFINSFDFGIFTFKTALEAIDEHRNTPYFVGRFGGGLPDRPGVTEPPEQPDSSESRYIQQLFEAYGDHKKSNIKGLRNLQSWPDLEQHYHRQREFFYHAEALRNFARDTVPPGTYDELKGEVYAGVADLESSLHPDAYARLNSVTQAAAQLPLSANGLITVVKVQDKRGICHQLANEGRLLWRKP
ncbi:MAG: hypothetical protein IPI17_06935 [Nitrosomonas sp.]|jgi:hypothetical protein|nr:hypothetical protein [Nitrosomonas sp.]